MCFFIYFAYTNFAAMQICTVASGRWSGPPKGEQRGEMKGNCLRAKLFVCRVVATHHSLKSLSSEQVAICMGTID